MTALTPQPSFRLRLTAEQVSSFLDASFPAATRPSLGEVESLALNHLRMRLDPNPTMQRPGNIVSGPALMALADVAAWAVIVAHHGPEAMVVTSSLSISFLRACQFEPIFADAQVLKLGRRMATADVRIWQGAENRLVAQSTVAYAIP